MYFKRHCWRCVGLIVALSLTGGIVTGQTIYVDAAHLALDGDGSTWLEAYRFLQDALAVATAGNEIRVAQGTYPPDADKANPVGTAERHATFQLITGVALYGGYRGCPGGDCTGDPDERDVALYESILSGDIGLRGIDDDNSYHVVTASGTDSTAVLDGFTIKDGQADAAAPNGAGMYSTSPSSPTIIGCTFRENFAVGFGGGIYNTGSPTIINCRFLNNMALAGGGMSNDLCGASPTLTNCVFSGNTAEGAHGGAMYNLCGNPVLANCTFSLNEADDYGGGIYTATSDPTLTNCILWGNSDAGGGDESGQIHVASGSPVINYTVIEGWTGSLGGTGNSGSDPLFIDPDGDDNEPGTPDDNLRLSRGSPCRDAGDNTAVPADVGDLNNDGNTAEPTPYDLDGNPRFVDDYAAADTGIPEPPIVDMGAYEASSSPLLVDDDATGAGDGTTWADAFTSLQDALAAADSLNCTLNSPCQIWVAAGTYRPDQGAGQTQGNPQAGFHLLDNVGIYGGFAGDEVSRLRCVGGPDDGDSCSTDEHCQDGTCEDVRDFVSNETILSGDLAGDDEITDCVPEPGHECYDKGGECDSEDVCREIDTGRILTRNVDNSRNVVRVTEGEFDRVFLDGFTVTGGNATGAGGGDPPEPGGGGIRFVGGQATIRNCTIKVNQAENGGGGIYCDGELNSYIVNCLITENWAGGGAGHGAGIGAKIMGEPWIVNCRIVANRARDQGAGVYIDLGGGGPGERDVHIVNTVIARNKVVDGPGGGILLSAFNEPGALRLVNSTVAYNRVQGGAQGGGMALSGGADSAVYIDNSIVWANEAVYNEEPWYGMQIRSWLPSGRVTVQYSNVQDLTDKDVVGTEITGPGNLGDDEADEPLFVDPDARYPWVEHDFALRSWSPGIDAADNDLIPPDVVDLDEDGDITELTPWDLLRRPRQADDEGITDTGNGTPPIVDMGAYEFQCASLVEEPELPPEEDEASFAKNRYLSFVPGSPGLQTAIRVTLIECAPFPDDDGQWWLGEPEEFCENSGKVSPPCPQVQGLPDQFMGAKLQCTPHYMDWHGICEQDVCVGGLKEGESCGTDEDCRGVVHVYGVGTVPSAWTGGQLDPTTYAIQAIYEGCSVGSEDNFSAPLEITMARWGDIVRNCVTCPCGAPDGVLGIPTDVTAVLDKFKNLGPPTIPCPAVMKVRADLDWDCPNRRVDASDVTFCLDAFRGVEYPPNYLFEGPEGEEWPCP